MSSQFLPSSSFQGAKPGYYFSNGSQGLGYYYDPIQESTSKRKQDDKIQSNQEEKKIKIGN